MPDTTNIFLIDDDEVLQMIFKAKIGKVYPKANIVSLLSGEDALEHINSCSKEDLPTILFLDVNMSGMNGWDFIAELKRNETPCFPIYMTSASVDPKDNDMAKQEPRVAGFLEKPLKPERVRALIESLGS